MRLFILTFIALCTIQASCFSQVVNVEAQRIKTDTIGWAGSIGGSFNWTQNVEQIFAINTTAHLQYKSKKNLYLLLGDYALLKSEQKNFINNAFLHFRFNHTFTEFLRAEVFTQLQNNKISKIDTRYLIGAGPRFKFPMPKTIKFYLGVLIMYEYEKEITEPPIYNSYFRNSTYLSITYKPNDIVGISSTTFYQPRMDYFSDFRILNQTTISLAISKKLAVTINWNYLYDEFPVEGVPKINANYSTGFKYVFNP